MDLPRFTPTGIPGHAPACLRECSRLATISAPSLLKPSRLMTASSSGSRKRRGLGLPGCARAVTVPISAKPKPSASHAGRATAFLSKPAASPSGAGKRTPNTERSKRGSSGGANWRSSGPLHSRQCMAKWCTSSGSKEKRSGRTQQQYRFTPLENVVPSGRCNAFQARERRGTQSQAGRCVISYSAS